MCFVLCAFMFLQALRFFTVIIVYDKAMAIISCALGLVCPIFTRAYFIKDILLSIIRVVDLLVLS